LASGEYCEFGEGDVDLAPIIEALMASGYDGQFTVEYEGPADGTLRLFQSVNRARVIVSSFQSASGPETLQTNEDVEIAHVLITEFVENASTDRVFLDRAASAEARLQYERRARVYRLALVLIALLAEEQRYPRIPRIRTAFESVIFGKESDLS